MSDMFGIKLLVNVGEYKHYVGEDAVLWDWLKASNILLANRMGSSVLVPAPEGYVFNEAEAVIEDHPAYDDVQEVPSDYSSLTRTAYVHVGTPRVDKARMLLREEADVLTAVSPEEFAALKIDEARVMDVRFS